MLESSTVSSLDAELSDAETVTLTEAVNEIWGAAAIRWEVVAVFREEAVESQAWVDMVEGREPPMTSAVLSALPMENRIAGHELGHSLGLVHVACVQAGNLMAPGCPAADRTRLEPDQISTARGQAATGEPFSF